MRIAIVGGGWAGLAAAVRAVTAGHQVTLLEMASALGGRARTVEQRGEHFDNGQHILIGAYQQTLALMRQLGVDPDKVLRRLPLALRQPDGRGLALSSSSTPLLFCGAVLRHDQWPWAARAALLRSSAAWALRGFTCSEGLTVEALTRTLPPQVRRELTDPLCVAALNTPAAQASAQVFLRVLKDTLLGGRGSADLLIPRQPMGDLLPEPALEWLRAQGAEVQLRCRVGGLARSRSGWDVDGQAFDHVVLCCAAAEAARLALPHHPEWSAQARSLTHESITTVYLACQGARFPFPMVLLPQGPAQFAFDHGLIDHRPGRFAFVISAADEHRSQGREALGQAVVHQALTQFPTGTWPRAPEVIAHFTEQRATFRCEPGASRPPAVIGAGLWAAGDFVQGPYPATLEGAVRSGQSVIDSLT